MAWKKIAGAGIAASAGVGLLFAAVNPASAAGDYPEKAFALQVKALGENVVAPTPYVESPDGEKVEDSIVSIPAADNDPTLSLPISEDAPVTVKALWALAEKNHAESRAAQLDLGGDGGIKARVISATCKKAEGSTEIANLVIGNNDLSGVVANPEPNTEIGVPGLLEITLNEQYMNDGSLTVNAVHVAVAPELSSTELNQLTTALDNAGGLEAGAGMTELSALGELDTTLRKAAQAPSEGLVDVIVASATCGNATDDDNGDDGDNGDDDDDNGDDGGDNGGDNGTAPKPTPVETQHAVTG